MLGKLLKYEMKAMGRIVLPFYAALIGVAILFSISLAINGFEFDGALSAIMNTILVVALVCLFIASGVVCLVLIIQRYYRNLLGDEGYLMFSLPVKTSEHIACKTISAMIWSTLGVLAGLIAVFVLLLGAVGPAEVMEALGRALKEYLTIGIGHAVLFPVEILVLILLNEAAQCAQIFSAISIGHLWSEHRILGAILAYIVISTVSSVLVTIIGLVLPWEDIGLWIERMMSELGSAHLLIWGLNLINLAITAIFSAISWYMLDRRLNLQ